jgi:hypothetical protein
VGRVQGRSAGCRPGSRTASRVRPPPTPLAELVRNHWKIEALHHVRDTTVVEDASRLRAVNAPRVGHLTELAIGAPPHARREEHRGRPPPQRPQPSPPPRTPRPRMVTNGTSCACVEALSFSLENWKVIRSRARFANHCRHSCNKPNLPHQTGTTPGPCPLSSGVMMGMFGKYLPIVLG